VSEVVLKPSRGWRAIDVPELWRARDLLLTLAVRDIKLRYRQTALGILWVILQPLVAAAIFAFVFGRLAKFPSEGTPYVVFAYAGTLGWNVFNSTIGKSSTSLVAHAGMVQKVYFPRLALPLSTVFGTLLDFGVGLVMMVVLMLTTGTFPGPAIVTLPFWILLSVLLGLGLGTIAAALAVSYRDVNQVLPVILQMLLYISPVAYSLEAIPVDLRWVFSLNPMVGILEGFRWSLISGGHLRPAYTAYSAAIALALFFVGAFVFTRMERRFADVV
jgi:lipopolysaccharide transport system permease protein